MTRLYIFPNDQIHLIVESEVPAVELTRQINAGELPDIILDSFPGAKTRLRAICSGSQVIVLPAEVLAFPMRLTPVKVGRRQRQVLQALADGLTSQQIAFHLHLSSSTVEQHIRRLRARLHAESRQQLVARAVLMGLCELEPDPTV